MDTAGKSPYCNDIFLSGCFLNFSEIPLKSYSYAESKDSCGLREVILSNCTIFVTDVDYCELSSKNFPEFRKNFPESSSTASGITP
jgi:hypothetical protein